MSNYGTWHRRSISLLVGFGFISLLVAKQIFYMWAGLLSNVIKIFGFVLDDIEKESSLTPQALKIVLCTTPHLLLLLVNTSKDSFDSDGNKELVAKLSVQIAIDLFDAVEMLDIFWTTKNTNSTFPKNI